MDRCLVLVEDEDAIARPLGLRLAREGFRVERFESAEPELEALGELRPDVVVLDLALPGISGLEACRRIRESSDVPIMILTAAGDVDDRVRGLEAGADDYVVKPFSAPELSARLRAITRRGRRGPPAPMRVGELELFAAGRLLRRRGEPVHLTAREFDLVTHLMQAAPRVVPREELMSEVWDPHWHGPTKTLDVHVRQLRRKIEDDPASPRYLHTERGVGYRMEDRWPDG